MTMSIFYGIRRDVTALSGGYDRWQRLALTHDYRLPDPASLFTDNFFLYSKEKKKWKRSI